MSPPPDRRTNGGLDRTEIEELRLAAAALREEISTRFGHRADDLPPGPGPSRPVREHETGVFEELASRIDLMSLFDELRSRFSVFGIENFSAEVDEFGLDALYLDRWRRALDFLFDRWWRVQLTGAENIPEAGHVLFVANRAGILPYDGLMIAHAVERERGGERRPRFMVADWLVGLPFSQPLLARIGGVRACAENAERLLRSGRWVAVFPEGQKGALKPYHERYRLKRFARGGFVSIAVRERAMIVPVSVVGPEETHPVLFQWKFASRLLGLPVPVTPTFPALGPFGLIPLPSRWRIRFGAPLRFDDVPVERADDPLYVNRIREQVRQGVQLLVDEELKLRPSLF